MTGQDSAHNDDARCPREVYVADWALDVALPGSQPGARNDPEPLQRQGQVRGRCIDEGADPADARWVADAGAALQQRTNRS